ncbi:uncharacterized protein LOC132396952 [Hypanus sabinus]|uniref:uncharacterized protein LOC132396952 n=1 Tax=Hypanus sabinus TaxID=79690 RepID=UPI0028C50B76|nr:uncharacterized protein LOC132396952 [Hypanus sabinus]
MVTVFLDIERAYDSLWKDSLLIKLYDAGIRGRMFNWIKDFLKEKTIQVRIGRTSSKSVKIDNVTLQGSVISPVFFNVMINNNFEQVGTGFGKSLFADDGAIWKRGRNIKYILKQLQGSRAISTASIVNEYLNNKWGSYLKIFTDGSVDPDSSKGGQLQDVTIQESNVHHHGPPPPRSCPLLNADIRKEIQELEDPQLKVQQHPSPKNSSASGKRSPTLSQAFNTSLLPSAQIVGMSSIEGAARPAKMCCLGFSVSAETLVFLRAF